MTFIDESDTASGGRSITRNPGDAKARRRVIGKVISGETLQTHKEIVAHDRITHPKELVVVVVDHRTALFFFEAFHGCTLRYTRVFVDGGCRRSGFGRVTARDGLRREGLLAGGAGERVAVSWGRVVVLGRVGNYEHIRVGSVPLHLFSGHTTL